METKLYEVACLDDGTCVPALDTATAMKTLGLALMTHEHGRSAAIFDAFDALVDALRPEEQEEDVTSCAERSREALEADNQLLREELRAMRRLVRQLCKTVSDAHLLAEARRRGGGVGRVGEGTGN